MARTVIGLFQSAETAKRAQKALADEGLERRSTRLYAKDDDDAKSGDVDRTTGDLKGYGVPDEEAKLYAESLHRGNAVLVTECRDEEADRIAEIMDGHGALDRAGLGLALGTTGTRQSTETRATTGRSARAGRDAGEIRESVVEEEVRIGKRAVPRGGVRVYSRITEQPVREEVTLREEEIDVQRRPVDRPANEADFRGRQEEVIVEATSEEPVVQKQARVKEEVVVSKEARERTEQIQETARRKDVEVERIPGQSAQMREQLDPEFRQHHTRTFGSAGMEFEATQPAYEFGTNLGRDPRNVQRDWMGIREDARRDWEMRSPGTFDRMEPAIRYAYDRGHAR